MKYSPKDNQYDRNHSGAKLSNFSINMKLIERK